MSRSGVGQKRGREGLKFIPGLTLSQHPAGQRKELFMKKLDNIIRSKSLHPTEFQGYTIRERFEKMGWGELLNLSCDKIYKRVVIQWVASLSRNGDELTGIVDGKSYTITPAIIRDVLRVDTRKDLPYARFRKADFEASNDGNKRRWAEACKIVFGIEENMKEYYGGYSILKMAPLVRIVWRMGGWTFYPRNVDMYTEGTIYRHEMYLLQALFTGDYLYSFAHLMIDNIWNMYEQQHRKDIPHGSYISEILNLLGAVSEDEYVEIVTPRCRVISRSTFYNVEFSESLTEYIIDDRNTEQRVTFPKVIGGETVQVQPPFQPLTMNQLLISPQNLDNTQSQFLKMHGEMVTMVTNIQKQMERKALEAERRAHAIIWDIERQRYFYEQEQEQLHKAWNQAYGSDVFQFPQISRASFHPLQAGSQYYDPAQGDAIPKAFQDFFHDIYGTRH